MAESNAISKSRPEAKRNGHKKYFNGKPCPKGHIANRYTSSGRCIVCHREWVSSEKCQAQIRKWHEENKDKILEYRAKTRDKHRDKINKWNREYMARNKARYNAHCRKYQAQKMNATPAWADDEAISFFYECKPEGCEVDHIVPLQGELVCGLHVEHNLQWLPVSVNRGKRNRF